MSASVLFDAPGPKTRARHRLYGAISIVVLLALLGFVIYRFNETGQFEYDKWEPFVTPRYVNAILEALLTTLKMAALAIAFAVVFGALFGIGKLSDHGFIRWPCWAVVEFCRAVPVLLMMILIWFQLGIRYEWSPFWAVVLGLTLYNGSVLAEVFRAGILALPKGQSEAAYAIGMRKNQVMRIVLLPQAVKIMLPAIISQCVVTLKDTSLGYAVTAAGLSFSAKQIYTQFGNPVPTIIVISAIYIVVNLILTLIATWVQKRFVGEKKLEVTNVTHADRQTI